MDSPYVAIANAIPRMTLGDILAAKHARESSRPHWHITLAYPDGHTMTLEIVARDLDRATHNANLIAQIKGATLASVAPAA